MPDDLKKTIAEKLLDSLPTLLTVAGVALMVLGLSGGVTYNAWLPIPDANGRIVATVLGVVVAGVGVAVYLWVQSRRPTRLDPAPYGIRITYPRDGDEVDVVDVRGTIKKEGTAGATQSSDLQDLPRFRKDYANRQGQGRYRRRLMARRSMPRRWSIWSKALYRGVHCRSEWRGVNRVSQRSRGCTSQDHGAVATGKRFGWRVSTGNRHSHNGYGRMPPCPRQTQVETVCRLNDA